METLKRERTIWEEIQAWELTYFKDQEQDHLFSYEQKLANLIEKYQPQLQEKIMNATDTFIFHIHSLMKTSNYDRDVINQIIDHGRVFDPNIESITDLKNLTIDQLRFITDQHLAKQRLIALAQGGVTGLANPVLLITDLPTLLAVHLRSIQLVATAYGHDLRNPSEMILALKLFHVATMPRNVQKFGWESLNEELEAMDEETMLFSENQLTSQYWFQQPLRQLAKAILIFSLRKKVYKGVPLLSLALGATTNYQLAKQVTEVAHNFYQKRYILNKFQ